MTFTSIKVYYPRVLNVCVSVRNGMRNRFKEIKEKRNEIKFLLRKIFFRIYLNMATIYHYDIRLTEHI